MAIRFAINGLGRIGRALFRVVLEREGLEVVAVNDLAPAAELARLINYDSVHGRLRPQVTVVERGGGQELQTPKGRVAVFQQRDPARVPWQRTAATIVVEATGHLATRDRALEHRRGAVETVLVSALMPGDEPTPTLCPGVALPRELQPGSPMPPVISAASCTTHGLALVLGVLLEAFGVEHALINEVHSYTGNQRLLDGVHDGAPRRERSAAINIVPTTTAAPEGVERLLPSLAGRLSGQAVRVPTPNVALLDVVAELGRAASAEEVRRAFLAAGRGGLRGVLGCSDEPLVSSDFIGDPRSAIIDLPLLRVVGDRLCRIGAWYDNEWGYAHRLADFLTLIGERIR